MDKIKNDFYKNNLGRIILFNRDECFEELRRDAICPNVIHSDIWILRQQDRLSALDDQLLQLVKERFSQSVPQSNPFDGMSDDDILDNIKSRYCQTAAELKNYLLVLQREKESRISLAESEKEVVETPTDSNDESV